MPEQDHFLNTTPVDVAIKSLQGQVDQLKRIMNKTGNEKDEMFISPIDIFSIR